MALLITFGDDNKSTTCSRVIEEPETMEANQRLVEDSELPENGSLGRWILDGGEARLLTDAEIQAEIEGFRLVNLAADNRRKRDQLLAASDWTQVADVALTDEQVAAWAAYRAELRDVTSHTEWPELDELDWPTAP